MKERTTTRVSLTITTTVIDRVDEYAAELGLTRSAAVSVLCSQMLDRIALAKRQEEQNGKQITWDDVK